MHLYTSLKQIYVKYYYQLIPAFIIIIACVGSLVTYYITKAGMGGSGFFQLFLCTLGAMTYLAAVLAQIHREKSFFLFFYGLLLELILLIINLIF